MITSILNKFGWRRNPVIDELNQVIREYIEAQPPLPLESCFCSSLSCEQCGSLRRQSLLSCESLSQWSSAEQGGTSHTCCEPSLFPAISSVEAELKSRRKFDNVSMLQKWIHELETKVRVYPFLKAQAKILTHKFRNRRIYKCVRMNILKRNRYCE